MIYENKSLEIFRSWPYKIVSNLIYIGSLLSWELHQMNSIGFFQIQSILACYTLEKLLTVGKI